MTNTDKKGAASLTLDKLRTRLATLEDYWTKGMKYHMDLSEYASALASHEYFQDSHFAIYEEAYISAKTELSGRIAALTPPSNAALVTGTSAFFATLALPKLPLPTFSGKQCEWETFKDRFCARVKNDPAISPVVKLHRLLSGLQGEAARRLHNLEVTSANFEVAWDNLVRRFDNKRLGRPVDTWDDWLIAVVEHRLDPQTREDWAKSLERTQHFPTYTELADFLEDRARTLDSANTSDQTVQRGTPNKSSYNTPIKSVSAFHLFPETTVEKTKGRSCVLCSSHHFIAYCPAFLKLNRSKRVESVQEKGLCFNCLRRGHAVATCPSKSRCRTGSCNQPHHTLLHPEVNKSDSLLGETGGPSSNSKTAAHTAQVSISAPVTQVDARACPSPITLLGTARVTLQSSTGTKLHTRALIDPGSESSFLSERVVQALSLKRRRLAVSVTGIGGEVSITSKCLTEVTLFSPKKSEFSLLFSAFVLPKLTSRLPRKALFPERWPYLEGLELADPDFHSPGGIDCILGGDVYPALMLEGLCKGDTCQTLAQNTVLGWILTGPISSPQPQEPAATVSCCTAVTSPLCEELRRFWEIEEIPAKAILSEDDAACEEHFVRTHRRDRSGRYVVRLPFSKQPSFPGSSKIAFSRFFQTERRLLVHTELQAAYSKFMAEFLSLGHMEKVPADSESKADSFFLPHHAVLKQDGSGKIRVVFNASQPAQNKLSLNDCLHTGPKLQSQIHAVLTRWRFPQFVFTADIVKMFRQFLVDREDIDWQRMFWREKPDDAMNVMRLLTVTYGTASAPYLAIRVLRQLAQDERLNYPKGASILEDNVSVDDALAGEDTLEEAICARDQLIGILQTAGMQLDKWSANNIALTKSLNSVHLNDRSSDEIDAVSTLGLRWHPKHDHFFFKVNQPAPTSKTTKRAMASEVARLFDPLGWLAPVIIIAKILIQRMWLKGADWDQIVDQDTASSWIKLRSQLPDLEHLRIPRWLGSSKTTDWFLHVFSDASQHAYAAAIYAVVLRENNTPMSMLLAAKTKVAPIKTLSIPRLELCAAALLVKLITSFTPHLHPCPAAIYCWSDSQVTLAWLASHPSRWTIFVANRASEIRTSLPEARWAHVRSAENPADLATRGVLPTQIQTNDLWWHGPGWLITNWGS